MYIFLLNAGLCEAAEIVPTTAVKLRHLDILAMPTISSNMGGSRDCLGPTNRPTNTPMMIKELKSVKNMLNWQTIPANERSHL